MKKYICFCLLLVMGLLHLNAQNALPRTYEYDDACNRIMRKTVELRQVVAQEQTVSPAAAEQVAYAEQLADDFTVRILPNPTKGQVCVQFSRDVKEGYYQILNMSGQMVYQGKCSASAAMIDFSSFPAGTYMLYLSLDGKRDTWKVVKE